MPNKTRMARGTWIKIGLGLLLPGAMLVEALREASHVMTLRSLALLPEDRLPRLSIVVAARDEAATLEPALCSLLELDYPELEVILVDDRSSDGTSEIVDQVKATHPQGARLTVIHNRDLPEGWLGEVCALHLGPAQE